MTFAAGRFSRSGRSSATSHLIAFIAVLAFTLQSFIIQTHIHGVSQGFDGAAIVKNLATTSDHGKSPIDNSPVDCPFCQVIAHTGAFFTPAAPLLLLPTVWVECEQLSATVQAVISIAIRNWRSRAPPQH